MAHLHDALARILLLVLAMSLTMREEMAMESICEVCGNDYDKAFRVVMAGETHVFDCFECAIHSLAPSCSHCGCRVMGHGVESGDTIYCSHHCASSAGANDAR